MSDPTVSHTVLPATVDAPAITTCPHRRAPFGWPVFAVDDHQGADFSFRQPLKHPGHLRLAVAIDIRTPAAIRLKLRKTGTLLHEVDLGYASPLQLIDVKLTGEQAEEASTQGLTLIRCDPPGDKPDRRLFFFDRDGTYPTFAPRLIAPAKVEPLAAFMARLGSSASLAPYGWPEAAVLDALIDLKQASAVNEHLEYFFDTHSAIYEDQFSRPQDGEVQGIDHGAMYACLARVRPTHPLLDGWLTFIHERKQSDGVIRDPIILAEHAYAIAYPLAVIGRMQNNRRLLHDAIQQLRLRRDRLRIGGHLYGRCTDDGRLGLKNDSRAAGLYLLGLARCLSVLPPGFTGADDLKREAQLVAHWAAKRQRPDGLWPPALNPPRAPEDGGRPRDGHDPAPDTNGSAALGAAFARLASEGIGNDSAAVAKRALAGLFNHLTPDGMLAGAIPAYKPQSGEELINAPRRVISQAAMGFTGQLLASLKNSASV